MTDERELPDSPAGAEGETASDDWRTGIEDAELRRVAGKFDSPAEALRAYASLERRLGRSVVMPGKDADPEEIAAFRRRLGVPERPEDYPLALPENGDAEPDPAEQELRAGFLAAMHEAGATPEVVQRALDWYHATLEAGASARAAEGERLRAEAEAELARAWGGDYQRNLTLARRAARDFGGADFAALVESAELDGRPLGDHPAFLRTFAAIGRRLAEAEPLGAEGGGGPGLEARIDALHALQASDPGRYTSNAVQRELQELYRRLHGSAPVVGAAGRGA